MVDIEYHRKNGEWKLIREHIDGRIRDRNPQVMARVTAIDLPLACSIRRRDTPQVREWRKERVPWKHIGLLVHAVVKLGLYPRSMHEEISDEKYSASIVVESVSPQYTHLG